MKLFNEPLFKALFNTPQPRVILDTNSPEFSILTYNNAYLFASNDSCKDQAGENFCNIFEERDQTHGTSRILRRALIRATEFSEKVTLSPLRFVHMEQNEQSEDDWWRMEICPVADSSGKPEYLIVTLEDANEEVLEQEAIDLAYLREQSLVGELEGMNDQLAAVNENLKSKNDQLQGSQIMLHSLANELEERVAARTKELSESEAQFRLLADSIIQMVWITDAAGMHEYYNQRWYDFTGTDFSQGKGLGWNQMFHPDDRERAMASWNHSLKTGEPYEIEYRLKNRDGDYVWVLGRAAPFFDSSGKIVKWFGTCTDINDLKELEEQKDDFISIASHELKTPLTGLKASLQILSKQQGDIDPAKIRHFVNQACRSSDKVISLVDDLLTVSKLNHGQIHLNKTYFTLSDLTNDCCSHISLSGDYYLRTVGDTDLVLFADYEKIEQVLINLVNNAVKYAPLSKEILIRIEKEEKSARISVTDKGPGINGEKLTSLFDRYYRVDHSGTRYSGLGLGLYISNEIIKRHNGRMGVESKINEGSTFWFTIPMDMEH